MIKNNITELKFSFEFFCFANLLKTAATLDIQPFITDS